MIVHVYGLQFVDNAMVTQCGGDVTKQKNDVTKDEWDSSPEHLIQRKLDEYSQSFTIHGLSRSVRSKKAESVFWITMLLVGLLCAFFVIYGLVKKYNSHVVYTELTSKITDENFFPSITFCEETLLKQAYFAYCGKSINMEDEACLNYKDFENNVLSRSSPWSTRLFNVTQCFSWGSKRCDNDAYFVTKTKLNNSCITWNYNGTFHDTYGHVDIKFDFHRPKYMSGDVQLFAIPHDHNILEIDLTKKVEIDADHKYEIKIDKMFIKRLPAPYPSNCSDNKADNIFEGKYTRFNCIESHYYLDMYKRCGDVFDYIKKYIPTNVVESFRQNRTSVQSCLRNYTQRELRNLKRCQFACEVLDLNYFTTFQMRRQKRDDNNGDVLRYQIGIQLKTANEYRIMEEKQLYTLSQMACEIGGFVGLIMGMSMISVIEVVVFVVLTIAKRIMCMTKGGKN